MPTYRRKRVISLFTLLTLLLVQMAQPLATAKADTQSDTSEPPSTPLWTTWGADQYALADDGPSLWIGATGSVVRWNKQNHTYRRYTAVDRLPHTKVLAIAVDSAGNRWFGGDGGLSRLDASEQWTHFTTANSALHSNMVDAIAVTANDTLYVSHGLPDGSISRRQADGSWRWFPNRTTAIQADYTLIQQTRNRTALWTVAGAEIWSGFAVFDGAQWYSRLPPSGVTQPMAMVANSANHVWVVAGGIYEWDGLAWLAYSFYLPFSGRITALTIDAQDTVWVGWQERQGNPYVSETAAIRPLSDGEPHYLGTAGPVAALLPTAEGVWGMGPDWLALPDRTVFIFDDVPHFGGLADGLLDATDTLWFYSGYHQPYSVGVVQTLADQGTATLADDQWQLLPVDDPPATGRCETVTAFERAANGDVWYTSHCQWRGAFDHKLVRYHDQRRIEYNLTNNQRIYDIFAQDAQHLWFAFTGYEPDQGVLSLDDRGTPTDMSDDLWQTYPITTNGGRPVVAVDAGGKLWYGDSSGLYRATGSTWTAVDQSRGICDLAPAADGTLYVQVAAYQTATCGPAATDLWIVRPDGTLDLFGFIPTVVQEEFAQVSSAARRNSLWTVAADGAIWYVTGYDLGQELQRRDAGGLQSYALPVPYTAVQRLEVDARNRVWLLADAQIWRMSPPLDFALAIQPTQWLLAPARTQEGQITIRGQEDDSGTVTLTVMNAPAALTVRIEPNPVAVGHTARLILAAAPDALPATYPLVIQGNDTRLTHTITLTVTVVETLYDYYYPIITR